MRRIYEHYHHNRKLLKEVIPDTDFTYKTLIYFLNKYGFSNKRILDIGCGVGTIDFYLTVKRAKVTGIDISKNAIKTALNNQKKLNISKNLNFKVLNFPFEISKSKYDLIICSEVLEHIPKDSLAVEKIYKLLKSKGIVIASSPSKNAPLYRLGLLGYFDHEVGHLRRYSVKSYSDLFIKNGFEILEMKKTEGIVRNYLFTSSLGGFLLKVLNKKPFSEIVTLIDDFTISFFGESNIYLVARKK